ESIPTRTLKEITNTTESTTTTSNTQPSNNNTTTSLDTPMPMDTNKHLDEQL
ncbi:3768_t:CDS:1, partial [Dentiscutata heterogama]